MERISEVLADAIVATGSKHYWSKSLIERFEQEISFSYLDKQLVIDIIKEKMQDGEEFAYGDLLKEIKCKTEKQKQIKHIKHIKQEDYKAGWEAYLVILEVARTSKDIKEFFSRLIPLKQVLQEKGLWKNEGRWAKWEELYGKEKT